MTILIGILFDFMGMAYYHTDAEVSLNDVVIVKTDHGTFSGRVGKIRKPTDKELQDEHFEEIFPPILRVADFRDMAQNRANEEKGRQISEAAQKQANELKLGMKVLRSYTDLVDDKVLITFTSDARVDFRDLVRILSGTYHTRIELRQIGPRDQAKIVGGIGPCGLPLCCSTFLNTFDGISIAMAKNQLLAINIPKLSGQCGKLMCCLKFEDYAYTQLRPLFPKIGEKFTYMNKNYEVTGLNLLTSVITAYDGSSYETFTKDEFERVKKGLSKVDETLIQDGDINSGVNLSGLGVEDTAERIEKINKFEQRKKEEKNNQNNNKNNSNKNNRNGNQNNHNNNNNNHNGNQNNNNRNNNNNNNRNNGNRNNNNGGRNNHQNGHRTFTPKKDSGFIPVSQIADKSVLDFTPVKKENDQK